MVNNKDKKNDNTNKKYDKKNPVLRTKEERKNDELE